MMLGASIRELTGKMDRRQVGRFAIPFMVAVVSRLGQVVLAVYVARQFGVEDYGLFIFAIGTAVVTGLFADFSWSAVSNRMLPPLMRDRDWAGLRGLVRAADLSVLAGGLICIAGLLLVALWLDHLAAGLISAAILTIPSAYVFMRRQQLAAVGRASLGLLLDQGAASTAVLVVLLLIPMSIKDTICAYALFMTLACIVATIAFRRRLPENIHLAKPAYAMRQWLPMAGSIMLTVLPRILMTRIDVLMLAPLAGLVEAGIYGAALRITILMTFPQFVLQTIALPRFSRAFAHGRISDVRRLLAQCLVFAFVTTVPVMLLIILIPDQIMVWLFGEEFRSGSTSLLILGLGQLAISFGIPLASLITMGGGERAFGLASLIILGINIALGLILIPPYGATGAAIVTGLASVILLSAQICLAAPMLRDNGLADDQAS